MPNLDNPLSRYFRQPSIYIRLPSQGRGWPTGSINMPANGEIPVYPMTVVDEITYRTPDALFNGQAVVNVIQSCMPNILDAWQIPSVDIDAILVAIRIASAGHSMDISTQCPACSTEQDYAVDLRTVLDKFGNSDYTKTLTIGDLTVSFKPLNYQEMTQNNQIQFEQQKSINALNDQGISDENRTNLINSMMKKLVDVTVHAIAQSISMVRTPTAQVYEIEHIVEFLNNCDRQTFNTIRDQAISLREASEIRPLKIRCMNCQHEYEQMFTMDMANFFDSAS